MPFDYVASNKEGKLIRGISELPSQDSVIQDLESKGLVVVSVKSAKAQGGMARLGFQLFGFIRHEDKVVFTKHLAVMIRSGLSLLESLRILRDQAPSRRFRAVQDRIVRAVEQGHSLSSALERFPKAFSAFFVNVIQAGETAGTLAENLEHLAEQYTKDHELRAKVRNALLYPSFVIVAAVAIGFFFALYVIPLISGLFSGLRGIEMPLVTQLLIKFANYSKDNAWQLVLGTVGLVLLLGWILRLKVLRPLTHGVVLKLPLFGGLVQNVNLARFCLVFGTQLQAGIPILQALDVTSRVLNNWHFKKAVAVAAEGVKRGAALSESMAESPEVFPRLVVRMIEVGERSGRLEEILGFLADFYFLEVETTIKNLTTIMEPVMLAVIGLLALALAYAIIIPIYNYVSAIGDMGRR
jgi:type IV pilus assembly protein PilC